LRILKKNFIKLEIVKCRVWVLQRSQYYKSNTVLKLYQETEEMPINNNEDTKNPKTQ
jgi:hypothetical protein